MDKQGENSMIRPVNIAPDDHFPVIVDGDDIAMISEITEEDETFIELRSQSKGRFLLIAMKEGVTAQGIADRIRAAGTELIAFPAHSSSGAVSKAEYINPAAVCYFTAGERAGKSGHAGAFAVLEGGVAGTNALSAEDEDILAAAIERHIPQALSFTNRDAQIVNHHVSNIARALCDPRRITRVYCNGPDAAVEFRSALLRFKGFGERRGLSVAEAAMELAHSDREIQVLAKTDMGAAWKEAMRRTRAEFAREEEECNRIRDAFARRVAAEAGLDEFEGSTTPSFMKFRDIRGIYVLDGGDAFTMHYPGARPGETDRANIYFRSPGDLRLALEAYEQKMKESGSLPVLPVWPLPKPPRPESP